jgi:hypothetical protein
VKLKTENGRVLLLFQILQKALSERNTVDVLDTLWEIEDVCRELDEDEVSSYYFCFLWFNHTYSCWMLSQIYPLSTDQRCWT